MNKEEIMNQLTSLSIDSLNDIREFFSSATEFTSEQAPVLIQQVLTYSVIINVALIITGVFLMVFGVVFIRKNHDEYNPEGYWAVGIITNVIGLPMIVCATVELVQIYLAPKIFLLNYFANLFKAGS